MRASLESRMARVSQWHPHVINASIDAVTSAQHDWVPPTRWDRLSALTSPVNRAVASADTGEWEFGQSPGTPHLSGLFRWADDAQFGVSALQSEDMDGVGATTGAHGTSHHDNSVTTFDKTGVTSVINGGIDPVINVLTPVFFAITCRIFNQSKSG